MRSMHRARRTRPAFPCLAPRRVFCTLELLDGAPVVVARQEDYTLVVIDPGCGRGLAFALCRRALTREELFALHEAPALLALPVEQ